MAVAKVIEIMSESVHSWEDAAQEALKEASKTVDNIKSLYVKEMQAIVEDDQIINYRINAKVTFVVEEK